MKTFIALLPFLFMSLTVRAQQPIDIFSCSRQIPGFGRIVDQYVEASWNHGQTLAQSHAELDRVARNARDCRGLKATIEQLLSSLRPQQRRPQPGPHREEEDEQVEEQRDRRRGFRLPRFPRLPQRQPPVTSGTRPRILVITDEPSARGAQTVQRTIETSAPWNCLGVEVVIEVLERGELGCEPRNDGRPRIVECSASASRKAQSLRRQLNAKKVLIVVDSGMQGGNGGPTPVITTSFLQHSPKAGMHELMHTMGFDDTYDTTAQYAATSGDIMACSSENCHVRPQDFGRIARALNVRLPDSCRED
jgi:hypothetical protein